MASPQESYELLYFPTWILCDVSRMILEISEVDYSFVYPKSRWPADKEEQKFGRLPCLTIRRADGTVHQLWESLAIEFYLAEKLGLLPQDLLEKAECLSIIAALNEAREQVSGVANVFGLPADQRKDVYEKHRTETIPTFLKYHENILAKNAGTFYQGDKPLLPDLTLLALYLRFGNMYAEMNPINEKAFPHIMAVVTALLANPKLANYVQERRDIGVYGWVKKDMQYGFLKT